MIHLDTIWDSRYYLLIGTGLVLKRGTKMIKTEISNDEKTYISRPMQQNQIAGNEDKGHLLENEM